MLPFYNLININPPPMKKLFTLISFAFSAVFGVNAQCDLDFNFINTGSNMTVFFTPPVASSIYTDLGAGTIGAFYLNTNGDLVCGASVEFTGNQIQLAVMADDSTTPEKDGFSAGESVTWYYSTEDGQTHEVSVDPADSFVINAMSFISSAETSAVDCGGSGSDDECPALNTDYTNTGANMTLFVTPTAASSIASNLGNGVLAVYFNVNGDLVCGGVTNFDGASAQIAANGDDSTTGEKDGFVANESIVWKFEDTSGNQYDLVPNPNDGFSLNGISVITGFTYEAISCAVDVEGCTDEAYLEYNPAATIDDGSCVTLKVYGCTDSNYLEYDASANTDDGSCSELSVYGCTDNMYLEYNPDANIEDGSCLTPIVDGCTDANASNYDASANSNDGSCEYDLIGANCMVSFETVNTGSNHTLMIPPSASSLLNVGDVLGVFYIAENGQAVCAGSTVWNSSNMQIVAYGDDATTPVVDGLVDGAPFLYIAQSGDKVYEVDVTYSNGSSSYITNGLSFVSSMSLSLSCTVEYLGCTDISACNYDAGANTDNGSCVYADQYLNCDGSCVTDTDLDGVCDELEIEGCMDVNASNYNTEATDEGYCEYVGCTDLSACNYDANANSDDGTCEYPEEYINCDGSCVLDSDSDGICDEFEVVGCMDANAANYDSSATDEGECLYEGCTDMNYMEYDPIASIDDGSCVTLIVEGCTDANAANYDPYANVSDNSCEYDLIGAGCAVSFEALNTGSNHTIMIPSNANSQLSLGDDIGVFYIADSGEAVCAGSSVWTGSAIQIVAFGDDATTPQVDGLSSGAPLLFIAQSADEVYVVDVEFSNGPTTYITNGLSFVSVLSLELACTVEYLGCTDENACNYDSSANTNDGSCEYAQEYLDCSGACLSDVDADGVCDELEVYGCTDSSMSNYNIEATQEDGSCLTWEEAYNDCVSSGGDDGVTQEDVDAVQALLDIANSNVVELELELEFLTQQLNEALENQEDGVSQADVDAIQEELDQVNSDLVSANDAIANLEVELANALANQEDGVSQADLDEANATIASLENQIEELLINCGDDGITQADVDAVQALLDQANADLAVALENQEDGVSQQDVDAVQLLLDASNEMNSQLQSDLDIALANQEDGVSQADVDAVQSELDQANADVSSLQAQLEEALANSGGSGSCDPIYVELLQGWNIVGYTLSFPQDVAATLQDIVDEVQIVKNNAAEVYWPEYGFNGIGDFVPGQGYQIRMHNPLASYTFPDVNGQRLQLSPTVPAWVHELPILVHPNDQRSLVKVVNMLGQEVDPENEFKGTVLLYLYSDGTTEKRMK